MLPVFGRDQCRESGDRIVLRSAIPKGWTARTPAKGTHAEYPGTTVEWDGRMLEVVEASASGEGVRYVLLPWREDHVIRTLDQYDAESEQRRIDDFERAKRQRAASAASRWSGVLLGHLPEPVQNRLRNELGVDPARMTLLSCIPPFIVLAICVLDAVDATMKFTKPRIPGVITVAAGLMVVESLLRFFVAMSQNRGMGSVIGFVAYTVYWAVSPRRETLMSPFREEKGMSSTFTLPPPPEVAESDRIELLGSLFSLLPLADQNVLARRHGYDYRRHAWGLTWGIFGFALLGVLTMYGKAGSSGTALLSFLAALAVSIEQVMRLLALRSRPAPSVFGFLVRPFMRKLLDEARRTAAD